MCSIGFVGGECRGGIFVIPYTGMKIEDGTFAS